MMIDIEKQGRKLLDVSLKLQDHLLVLDAIKSLSNE